MSWRKEYTYSFNDVVDELLRFVDLFLGVGHDKTMQILFLVAGVGGIRAAFALFDGSFSTDGNLGAGFVFHLLEGISTGSDK